MTEPSIVITGLAFKLPGADDQDQLWKLLIEGRDRTGPVSRRRRALARRPKWDDIIGEVDGIEMFDAEFFGIDDDEAAFMDPQHRMVMELAYDAVCDAGLLESRPAAARRYAVYTAMSTNPYYPLVTRHMDEYGTAAVHPRTIMNLHPHALPARVSHQYNLTGPVMAVDTACSSFLTAMVQAADSIRHQGCDGAVVAGVNLHSGHYTADLCNRGGITTAHPYTRVFDEAADGTLLGEGAVVCVLEREDLARRANRHIYGRVRGYAINNDGASLNIMAPNPRGQADVVRDCYAQGIDHTRIGYVEAHGTGTRIGDPIEVNALAKVYRKEDFGETKVGIGSVKANLGHLLSAAGGAGLAKLLLSLRRGQMAPSLHLERPNPLLQLEETPFEVVTEPRPWPRDGDRPRMGAITSLGLGGTNVHLVVEEGEPERPGPPLPEPLLCLSAKTELALRRMLEDVSRHLAGRDCDPYNLAMTLARFRPAHPWRASARFDPDTGLLSHVVTNHVRRPVKRVVLRPTTAERDAFARAVLTAKVRTGTEEPGPGELALVFAADDDEREQTLVIDPDRSDLAAAAALFVNGCPVQWRHCFPDGAGTVLTLAPYPFARTPHWLEP